MEDESKDDHREDDSSYEFMGEGDGEDFNDDGKIFLVVRRSLKSNYVSLSLIVEVVQMLLVYLWWNN
ncbi:hypothetical protein KY285_001429 [Solanum tuberosum]|nr:hypothetical protein KY285_001429 [Solanum tuberosum]